MNEDRRFNRPLAIRHPDFDLASEQKLTEVLQELESFTASFNAEDFASETTLSAFKTAFDVRDLATESTLEAARLLLLSLDGKDYATELTLDFFRSDFNSRDISTSAKQDDIVNQLGAVNLELDAQSARLDSLDSKDYATDSSLSDLNSKFNTLGQKVTAQSHPVVLSSEQEALLESIKTAIEDSPTGLATEATLAGLRSDFNLEDFASEATLSAFKTAFDSRDLATQTTLAAVLAELELKADLTETQPVSVQNFPASQTVDATALDIRNLSELSDSVTVHQGGTWVVDIQDNLDVIFPDDFPLPVSQVAELQNIRNLSSATDSVDTTGSTVSVEELNNDVYPREDSVLVSSTFQINNTDISGTLETAGETVLFSHFFRGIEEPRVWNTSYENGASSSINSVNGTYHLHVTSTIGSKAVLSSRRRILYAPGRTTKISMTFNSDSDKEGILSRHGLFDSEDGFYYRHFGADNAFVIRSSTGGSVGEITVDQQDWNVDRLDGTGPSGATLTENTVQFLLIEFFWQGAGGVRFGFQRGGQKIWCHEQKYSLSDALAVPFIKNPNLPLRTELENVSSVEDCSISIICNVAKVSGNIALEGFPVSANTGIVGKSVGQTLTPIMSIRRRPGDAFKKKLWELIDLAPLIAGNDIALMEIYLSATLVSPSWQDRGYFSQFSTAATGMSGGTLIGSAYLRGNVTPPVISPNLIKNVNDAIGEDINEEGTTLTIAARNFSGSTSFSLGVNWRER